MTASDLAGKRAIVTGASSGIGTAVAKRLASAGACVAVHYNKNADAARSLAAEIEVSGGTAFAVGGDVTKPADAQRIVDETVDRWKGLDILVNNAGILEYAKLGDIDPASFERQFSVNALSVLLMMQAALPHFPSTGGRIVNVSTNLSYRPIEGCVVYSASKAAVSAFTEGFAKELGGRGVTVNAVAPGATITPMTAWLSDDMKAGIAASTPLGRVAAPEDIAEVVAFFASDAARWITGRVLIVDGGLA